MDRVCDDCGATFETLSRLRLHDCPARDDGDDSEWQDTMESMGAEVRQRRRDRMATAERAASEELTDALSAAEAGAVDGAYQALAYFERHLAEDWSAERDDRYWGFHEVYDEPIVTAIDDVVQTEGWSLLSELLEAYWPAVERDFEADPDTDGLDAEREYGEFDDYPHVSAVLTNVTGRFLVRTRLHDGVEAIPPAALEYLLCFHDHPGDEGPWVESMTYGWGIGHPAHPFEDRLRAIVDGDFEIWAGTAFEHAFHADQHAAVSLMEDVLRNGTVSDPGAILWGVGAIGRGRYPDEPRYWDWEAVYPAFGETGFDWDPDVESRLRSLIEEIGFDRYLPQEWTFADIEL